MKTQTSHKKNIFFKVFFFSDFLKTKEKIQENLFEQLTQPTHKHND